MKKTIISIILSIVVILSIGGIWAYYISKTSNPWNARTIGEIPVFFFDEDDTVFWIGPFHFNENELRHY